MRVIAGSAGGRRLEAPAHGGTRPMTGRAREAIFSSLGDAVVGAAVLDLYAGSGSLGIEALSRGARTAVFVDDHPEAVRVIRRNLAALGLSGEVVRADAVRYLSGAMETFDLVFVDPPYAVSLASVESVVAEAARVVAPGGALVMRRRAGEAAPQVPAGLGEAFHRRYGDDEIWRYVRAPENGEAST